MSGNNADARLPEESFLEEEDQRRQLRVRLAELEARGFKPSFEFRCEQDVRRLQFEAMLLEQRLAQYVEQEQKVAIVQGVLQILQYKPLTTALVSAFEQVLAEKSASTKKITCAKCGVACTISRNAKPVQGFAEQCVKCSATAACIYQPQCGHVCLCMQCFLQA